ncbi:threonine ammonia-lyase IlvA [Nocardioides sp. zg-579]|uniref:L-threonine dehydratase n=1 Tax=Nocardioides marmotae TaxID=2663857 RepID=A0A6I3J3I5_9ACTN|nr:threonine ammonia-lyase IlvA [Gordonia jinghuaiqii]MTB93532.1 threonine ammonia-lyase IlvA [Nocardioides marmotae]QKD99903.1 threonine ammonia-lyase IlvA [Nocardioides marmotae]
MTTFLEQVKIAPSGRRCALLRGAALTRPPSAPTCPAVARRPRTRVQGVDLPTASDVEHAARTLRDVVGTSPLHPSPRLSAATGLDVWLKREDLHEVRSYKGRGAYNLVAGLSPEERERGVTCASAGNHAQGVAFACSRLGVRATIFLPRTTPRQKRARIAALGGPLVEVVVDGDTYDDADQQSRELARSTGAVVVPAFDDPRTIAGQGTVGLEVLDQLAALGRTPTAVVAPVGGGGLLAGLLTVLSERAPYVDVVGVEPAGAASMAAALAAGAPVELGAVDSFVDGAAVRRVGDWTHAVVAAHRPPLLAVPEGLVCVEMLDLYQSDGIIAEPAGALASAAIREHAVAAPGSTVVCVLSGGNNDVSRYAEVVERALVHEGLRHYFLVEFPQEPGALRMFLDDVLGPDDDIVLFEYVKRSNRETGPALVGIELQRPTDYAPLLERMGASGIRVQVVEPTSPLFRMVQ